MMRAMFLGTATLLAISGPATGQQQRFSFDQCFSRCMSLGMHANQCAGGCSMKAAAIARGAREGGAGGTKPGPNHPAHPQSPRYHDPDPSYRHHP